MSFPQRGGIWWLRSSLATRPGDDTSQQLFSRFADHVELVGYSPWARIEVPARYIPLPPGGRDVAYNPTVVAWPSMDFRFPTNEGELTELWPEQSPPDTHGAVLPDYAELGVMIEIRASFTDDMWSMRSPQPIFQGTWFRSRILPSWFDLPPNQDRLDLAVPDTDSKFALFIDRGWRTLKRVEVYNLATTVGESRILDTPGSDRRKPVVPRPRFGMSAARRDVPRCRVCASRKDAQCCARCHWAIYCSRACQRRDWLGGHRAHCND